VAAVGAILGGKWRYATDCALLAYSLQTQLFRLVYALSIVVDTRIVALEEVAGSSPVGHPPQKPQSINDRRAAMLIHPTM
jgi:hypothetical protein